mmetsp:Transcript_17221/g.34972  ORF Transcript_17221/g.34972 Transcript_17221/m.34972 type:complete len:214 (+) Transcript_17221:533-1174(+)
MLDLVASALREQVLLLACVDAQHLLEFLAGLVLQHADRVLMPLGHLVDACATRGGVLQRLGQTLRQPRLSDLDVLDLHAKRAELVRERSEHALRELLAKVVDAVVCHRIHETTHALLDLGREEFIEARAAKRVHEGLGVLKAGADGEGERQVDVHHHVVRRGHLPRGRRVGDRGSVDDMRDSVEEWPAHLEARIERADVLVPALGEDIKTRGD